MQISISNKISIRNVGNRWTWTLTIIKDYFMPSTHSHIVALVLKYMWIYAAPLSILDGIIAFISCFGRTNKNTHYMYAHTVIFQVTYIFVSPYIHKYLYHSTYFHCILYLPDSKQPCRYSVRKKRTKTNQDKARL